MRLMAASRTGMKKTWFAALSIVTMIVNVAAMDALVVQSMAKGKMCTKALAFVSKAAVNLVGITVGAIAAAAINMGRPWTKGMVAPLRTVVVNLIVVTTGPMAVLAISTQYKQYCEGYVSCYENRSKPGRYYSGCYSGGSYEYWQDEGRDGCYGNRREAGLYCDGRFGGGGYEHRQDSEGGGGYEDRHEAGGQWEEGRDNSGRKGRCRQAAERANEVGVKGKERQDKNRITAQAAGHVPKHGPSSGRKRKRTLHEEGRALKAGRRVIEFEKRASANELPKEGRKTLCSSPSPF